MLVLIMKERDFMGLNSKESVAVFREDNNDDGCRDSGVWFLFQLMKVSIFN